MLSRSLLAAVLFVQIFISLNAWSVTDEIARLSQLPPSSPWWEVLGVAQNASESEISRRRNVLLGHLTQADFTDAQGKKIPTESMRQAVYLAYGSAQARGPEFSTRINNAVDALLKKNPTAFTPSVVIDSDGTERVISPKKAALANIYHAALDQFFNTPSSTEALKEVETLKTRLGPYWNPSSFADTLYSWPKMIQDLFKGHLDDLIKLASYAPDQLYTGRGMLMAQNHKFRYAMIGTVEDEFTKNRAAAIQATRKILTQESGSGVAGEIIERSFWRPETTSQEIADLLAGQSSKVTEDFAKSLAGSAKSPAQLELLLDASLNNSGKTTGLSDTQRTTLQESVIDFGRPNYSNAPEIKARYAALSNDPNLTPSTRDLMLRASTDSTLNVSIRRNFDLTDRSSMYMIEAEISRKTSFPDAEKFVGDLINANRELLKSNPTIADNLEFYVEKGLEDLIKKNPMAKSADIFPIRMQLVQIQSHTAHLARNSEAVIYPLRPVFDRTPRLSYDQVLELLKKLDTTSAQYSDPKEVETARRAILDVLWNYGLGDSSQNKKTREELRSTFPWMSEPSYAAYFKDAPNHTRGYASESVNKDRLKVVNQLTKSSSSCGPGELVAKVRNFLFK